MKVPISSYRIGIAILLIVGILLCLGLGYLVNELRNIDPLEPRTDISEYPEIRNGYWGKRSHLLQHFPETIPPEATETQMYFVSTLVGGNVFQLKLTLPPSNIDELWEQYRAKATSEVYVRRDMAEGREEKIIQSQEIPTVHSYTSGSSDLEFPDSYEIIVLYAEASGSDENLWNHGAVSGVSIDKSAAEIVYWAEDW